MKELKVCFIGVGSIGKRHIKNLNLICCLKKYSLHLHVLRQTNRNLPSDITEIIEKSVYDFKELDYFYDMIFITNPTHLHYDTIMKTKELSNTFFIEKPVFDEINDNFEIMNLPTTNNYYVACPLRYTFVLQKAKNILNSIEPISIRAISSSYLPDWRPNIDYRNTYSAKSEQGGGVRIDIIHEWDYLSWLFGKPSNLQSFSGNYSNLEINSEDLAVYIAQYNNYLIELHLDYMGRVPRRMLEVYTNDEIYTFDILKSKIYRNEVLIEASNESPNDKYIKELEYFFALYEDDIVNENNLTHANEVMKIAYDKLS